MGLPWKSRESLKRFPYSCSGCSGVPGGRLGGPSLCGDLLTSCPTAYVEYAIRATRFTSHPHIKHPPKRPPTTSVAVSLNATRPTGCVARSAGFHRLRTAAQLDKGSGPWGRKGRDCVQRPRTFGVVEKRETTSTVRKTFYRR
jgi:hypothetical protein